MGLFLIGGSSGSGHVLVLDPVYLVPSALWTDLTVTNSLSFSAVSGCKVRTTETTMDRRCVDFGMTTSGSECEIQDTEGLEACCTDGS